MQAWNMQWTQTSHYRRGCKGELSCLKGDWTEKEAQSGWRALWKRGHWKVIQNWISEHPDIEPLVPLFSKPEDVMKAFHFATSHPAFQPIWIAHALDDALQKTEVYPKLLWVAIHHQQPLLLQALLGQGLSPWMPLNLGTAPAAGKAAREGWLEGVEIIAKYLSNPNQTDLKGNGLLHWAATAKQVEVIEWLLQQHADPNAFNQKRHTPLGILLRNEHFSPVDFQDAILPEVKEASLLLVKYGANPTLHQGKNKAARTALEWALHHDATFASLLERQWLDQELSRAKMEQSDRGKGRL